MKVLTVLLSMSIWMSDAGAANVYTDGGYKLNNTVMHSLQESIYPTWAGVVIIYPETPVTWIGGNLCNTNAMIIRNEDTHLISLVLAAYTTSQPVRLFADDSLTVDGNYCFLRAIGYQ